jgi:hypothetical protein
MVADIAVEIATPICPAQEDLDEIAGLLDGNTPLVPGVSRQRLAVCARRAELNTNVVSIGIWVGRENLTATAMRNELTGVPLLTVGHTCALRMSASLIRVLAEAQWATTSKKHGRVTLDDEIVVQLRSDRIVTKITGTYDPPLLIFPDMRFTYTITDRLELAEAGSRPPLRARTDTDIDVGTPGVLAASWIVGLVSPVLGAVVFFAADPVAESQAPSVTSLGSTLAAQWPPEILTRIRPPFLPGRFALSWTEVIVDRNGVLTLGTFSPEPRSPSVMIVGPRRLTLREAIGDVVGRYRIDPLELRPPLAIRWTGAARGTAPTASVLFSEGGTFSLGVEVTDVDGLSDEASARVQISVIPLQPGQQPF